MVPDLKEEHLVLIAHRIAQVRNDVVDHHDPVYLKDTIRGLGTRVYECTRNTLISESKSGDFDFLRILDHEGRFTFSINGFPVRFFRGGAEEDIEGRRLITTPNADSQMDLFGFNPEESVIWFFVVETDSDYYTEKVFVNGYKQFSGECVCSWEVPVSQSNRAPLVPINKPAEAVKLPDASQAVLSKRKKQQDKKIN